MVLCKKQHNTSVSIYTKIPNFKTYYTGSGILEFKNDDLKNVQVNFSISEMLTEIIFVDYM